MSSKFNKILLVFILVVALEYNGYAQEAPAVKWYSIEEVQTLVKQEPRKIFIDMYTDWCGWCKVMDKKTFTDKDVITMLNTDYYAVKFDAEGKQEVNFRGQTFKFVPQGSRGYHELAAVLMQGKLSYPTSVFLDENLDLISPLPGYYPPEKLLPVLEFIGKDYYKSTTYEQFLNKKGLSLN